MIVFIGRLFCSAGIIVSLVTVSTGLVQKPLKIVWQILWDTATVKSTKSNSSIILRCFTKRIKCKGIQKNLPDVSYAILCYGFWDSENRRKLYRVILKGVAKDFDAETFSKFYGSWRSSKIYRRRL